MNHVTSFEIHNTIIHYTKTMDILSLEKNRIHMSLSVSLDVCVKLAYTYALHFTLEYNAPLLV